ncbi:MAG: tetratricopeptide repeat protein [Pseudomonadota bacterium]
MALPLPKLRPVLALLILLALAACETAEERAEGHYQSALTLLDDGAREKAKIELRNVFRLNGQHQDARLRYATLLVEDGEFDEAVSQFLRLVEQNPEHLEARKELGRLMLLGQNWTEAERHIEAALALAPEDLEVGTLKATIDYRRGRQDDALARAREIIGRDSSNVDARLLLIADRMNAEAYEEALDLTDEALLIDPEQFTLQAIKLSIYQQIGAEAEIGGQLARMVALQPGNVAVKTSLFQWNLRNGDTDAAEAVLRDLLDDDPNDEETAVDLVRFLANFRGVDVAREELEKARQAPDPTGALYTRLLAELEIDQGNTDAAKALMEVELSRLEDEALLNDARNMMAQLERIEGNGERAAALIAEVLANDDSNVDALLERGRQRLLDDDYNGAISDLRLALNQSPENTALLTLLARAHERNGSRDLARERLALAVEVSQQGVVESLRYAEFLLRENRVEVAENVLTAALTRRPQNRRLLSAQGQLQLAQEDWEGAEATANRLAAIGTDEATRLAVTIRSRALSAQDQFSTSIEVLLGQLADDEADIRALRELTVTYLRAGETRQAEGLLKAEIEKDPGDNYAKFLLAGVYAVTSRLEESESLYREIIAFAPESATAWEALATLLTGTGRREEAEAIIAEAAATLPDASRLQILYAGQKERARDFEGAIEIYNRLYDRNPGSTVVANNLASLLAEHRDDQASLDRAATVAQRLRVARNPAFLDTYGWVLYRQGNPEQALRPLQQAVAALPDIALIEYHLGVVHAALGQQDEARSRLENALSLASDTNILPERARTEAERILADLDAPAAGGGD